MKTKAKMHKDVRKCFDKVMECVDDKDIDLYALFYNGFRTGYNYKRRESSLK